MRLPDDQTVGASALTVQVLFHQKPAGRDNVDCRFALKEAHAGKKSQSPGPGVVGNRDPHLTTEPADTAASQAPAPVILLYNRYRTRQEARFLLSLLLHFISSTFHSVLYIAGQNSLHRS